MWIGHTSKLESTYIFEQKVLAKAFNTWKNAMRINAL